VNGRLLECLLEVEEAQLFSCFPNFRSRTVTRGVIKGVKEDFKVTLEKQVARCNDSIERVIRQFLVDERVILQQNLL